MCTTTTLTAARSHVYDYYSHCRSLACVRLLLSLPFARMCRRYLSNCAALPRASYAFGPLRWRRPQRAAGHCGLHANTPGGVTAPGPGASGDCEPRLECEPSSSEILPGSPATEVALRLCTAPMKRSTRSALFQHSLLRPRSPRSTRSALFQHSLLGHRATLASQSRSAPSSQPPCLPSPRYPSFVTRLWSA
jgi:hypothetical protein